MKYFGKFRQGSRHFPSTVTPQCIRALPAA